MRRYLLVGGVAVLATAGFPAAAGAREPTFEVRMSGMVSAVWEASAARGCAAAGTCGTTGSATYRAAGIVMEVSGDGASGGGLAFEPVIVRVRSQDAAGPPSTCVDVMSGFPFPPVIALEGRIGFDFTTLDISAGRCAGPRQLDLLRALPSGSLSLRAAARRPRVVDMAGRTPFTAGPFAGQVISTVKARVRQVRRGGLVGEESFVRGPDLPSRDRRRHAVLRFLYRSGPVAGALTTSFRGRTHPACVAVGACGARGTSSYELAARGATVEVFAWRRQRRGPARKAALIRALRNGALDMEAQTRFPGAGARVVQSVATGGRAPCKDTMAVQPPEFVARRLGSAPFISLFMRSYSGDGYSDGLRTHCPGPTQGDVLPGDVLARGRMELPQLGQPALRVGLRPTAPAFLGEGYSGELGGELPLDLRLVAADARIERF